jgi:hypothetical protein
VSKPCSIAVSPENLRSVFAGTPTVSIGGRADSGGTFTGRE